MEEQLEETGKIVLKEIKNKDDKVILIFDDDKIKLFPETLDTYKVEIGEGYDRVFLDKLKKLDLKNEGLRYAIQLSKKKLYAEKDFKDKLKKRIENDEVVDETIKELKEKKIINDEVYCKCSVDVLNDSNYGKYFIVNYLKSKKINNNIIEEITFNEEFEEEKAQKYFLSIKNKYVSNNLVKQKKKIFNALLKRGFEVNIIMNLIKSLKLNPEVEEKEIKKDYLKIKNKILDGENKKLDNYSEGKIVSWLVRKGYS